MTFGGGSIVVLSRLVGRGSVAGGLEHEVLQERA